MTHSHTPWNARQVLDAYFLETRAKLLEIAATLDRIDRSPDAAALRADPRLAFIQQSLQILQLPPPISSAPANRAEQIQCLYSKA